MTLRRATSDQFLSWATSRGIFISSDEVALRSLSSSSSSLFGLFATKHVPAGSMFAVIPKHATLQASHLADFAVDGCSKGDSTVLPLAVRSIVRGAESEHAWWELAVVMSMYRCVPLNILQDHLLVEDVQQRKPEQPLRKRQQLRDFSGYLDFFPLVSPQQTLIENEALMNKLPPQVRSDFQYSRNLNMMKSAQLSRDVPILAKLAKASAAADSSSTSLSLPTLPPLTAQTILWAFDMVQSRANNFSFVKSTTDLRPYGISGAPILGMQPTMCPVFDMMNHVPETNVLVADTLVHAGAQPGAEQQEVSAEAESSAGQLQPLQLDEFVPAIVIGALRDINCGEEIGYAYAATPDVATSLSRWGFAPNAPAL